MKTLYNEEDPPAAPCVTGETKEVRPSASLRVWTAVIGHEPRSQDQGEMATHPCERRSNSTFLRVLCAPRVGSKGSNR